MDPQEPVKVYDAWNLQQAHMLCQVLLDAGIRARVASDVIETLSGKVPFQLATCPVWVAAVDVPKAMTIVEHFDQRLGQQGSAETVRDEPYCYHCGETIAAKQTSCPKCGGELEWSDAP